LLGKYNGIINVPTVGASGAVFGLLLAYGMMFPNQQIYLYFLFPIKAKYFVIGYGLIELFSGMANRAGDNVAHFAHLGGMVFGYILIKFWRRNQFRID
jgi:membrane associated rhomboid family serine protease